MRPRRITANGGFRRGFPFCREDIKRTRQSDGNPSSRIRRGGTDEFLMGPLIANGEVNTPTKRVHPQGIGFRKKTRQVTLAGLIFDARDTIDIPHQPVFGGELLFKFG